MIVLDTNVVSELMRPDPDDHVLHWVDSKPADDLHITSVTLAELLFGIERMPAGQRTTRVAAAMADMLDLDLAGRVLPFDDLAALEYARIAAHRERLGRQIGMADAMIAAITVAAGASMLATRNVKDFTDTGVVVADPWGGHPAR